MAFNPQDKRVTWTQHEEQLLAQQWSKGLHIDDICDMLNRGKDAIYRKANRMGLKKKMHYPSIRKSRSNNND